MAWLNLFLTFGLLIAVVVSEDCESFQLEEPYYRSVWNVTNCIKKCTKEVAEAFNASVIPPGYKIKAGEEIKEHFIFDEFCTNFDFLNTSDSYNAHVIHTDGGLEFENYINHSFYDYCLVLDKDNISQYHILQCKLIEDNSLRRIIYTALILVSALFLLFTLIAFLMAPEMQNLHGKNIACQSLTLMLGMIGLALIGFGNFENHANKTLCKITGYLTYFFLMSSFFWLNSMCFDIFWTFSNFKKMTGSLHETNNRKLIMYTIYCTLGPLTFFIPMMLFDLTMRDTSSILNPSIGSDWCWFKRPVLILQVGNIIFFSVAFVKIVFFNRRGTRTLSRTNSRRHAGNDDRQRLFLYFKLFLLMGGTWIMECISWWCRLDNWFWTTFDIINCCRGVLIFILTVATNQRVRNSILRRHFPRFVSQIPQKTIGSNVSGMSTLSDDHKKQKTTAL
ncbi:G-protein coupled receptor Mth2-like isoform X2 [Neocloeon triangulifer]|uniref:G-protein coupled receptor Mth2-like isoform X2 n=1 Tax=Neocloeon triangulifer TaxID=2078957 RepID=UPI00286EBE35|nr:G-protein coupled receptor Mth2-like isoform X2 [Neocloeon triangulifer]